MQPHPFFVSPFSPPDREAEFCWLCNFYWFVGSVCDIIALKEGIFMKLKLEFVLREIAGDLLLIPAGKTALDLNGMLTLNEVGAEIWKLLPEVETEDEIVARLLESYEVDEATLRADVSEFLDMLRKLGIV